MAKKAKKKVKNQTGIYPNNYLKVDNFFWITTNYKNILYNFSNIDNLIPNIDDKNFLKETIENLDKEINGNDYILISSIFKEIINLMKPIEKDLSIESKRIKQIIVNFPKNKTFYLKDISKEYLKLYGKKLSNKKIFHTVKFILGYRFRRTSIKNKKLLDDKGILMSFLFTKTILRGLQLGLELIFLDESGFQLQNSKYYRWRLPGEEFPYGPNTNVSVKSNLILAVTNKKVLSYKIIRENTTSQIFIDFIKDLFSKIPETDRQNKLVIMDNAKFHLTKEVQNIFLENKIKVITICPYNSDQNMIELVFRHIKNILKRKIFKSQKKLEEEILKILDDLDEYKNSKLLLKLYKRTLLYYEKFLDNNNCSSNIEMIFKKLMGNN